MRIFLSIICYFVIFICLFNKSAYAFRGGSVQYSAPSRSYASGSYRAPVYSAPVRSPTYVVRSPPSYNPAPVSSGNIRINDLSGSVRRPTPTNSVFVSSGNVRSRPEAPSSGDRSRHSGSSAQRPSSVPVNAGSLVSRPVPQISGFYILHRDKANSDSGLRRRLPAYYVPSDGRVGPSKVSRVVERPAPQKASDAGARDRQAQIPRPPQIAPKPATNERVRISSAESKPNSAAQNVARRPGPEISKESKPFQSAKELLRKPDGKPNIESRDPNKITVRVEQNVLLSRPKVSSPEAAEKINELIRTRPGEAQNIVSRVSANELANIIAEGMKHHKGEGKEDNKRQRPEENDSKRVRDPDTVHKRPKDDGKNERKKADKKDGKSEKKKNEKKEGINIRTRPPLPGTVVTENPVTERTVPPCNDCQTGSPVTPLPSRPTKPYPRTTTPIYQQFLHYYCWNYQTPGYPYCFDYFNIGSTGWQGARRASGASCPVTQFECANAHCVYRSQLCNSRNDCGDNSDEGPLANCTAKKVTSLTDKVGKRPGNETSMILATADQLAKLVAAGNQKP